MAFGIMQHLKITICKNAGEAVEKGYRYGPDKYTPVEIDEVIVVRSGIVSGASTVDLIIKDEAGNKYVVMVTGNLLKSIPC